MNSLLSIKVNFEHEKNSSKPGPRDLAARSIATSANLRILINNLKAIKSFYTSEDRFVAKAVIDVYYNDIIAKSNRMREVLRKREKCERTIVGARFTDSENGLENHIITHYVGIDVIDDAIKKIECAINLLDNELDGVANATNFKHDIPINYSKYSLSKTKIRDVIIDCSVIERFDIPHIENVGDSETFIITFYKTEKRLSDLLNTIGAYQEKYIYHFAGENTISASLEMLAFLMNKVPYLISMVASDISTITYNESEQETKELIEIPSPNNEPTIGVIDTMFDENAYFSKWVDNRPFLTDYERMSLLSSHYEHGTAVSSIIVDGPTLNPELDDGCGRFKVRHFGVCPGSIPPSLLIKKIRTIVAENSDIHVWNLSLGTEEEVSKNFISFDAAAIDEIQSTYNVIFIISGTNDLRIEKKGLLRVGSPADSLNSIVVNSVRFDGSPASYSRTGNVLSFFNKPDVSYYGGDFDEKITVCTNRGFDKQFGTSFAAPWIARKVCYLIDVLGFNRELAKALIIDSAASWSYKTGGYKNQKIIGYGVVPKKISSITETDNSEIRFTLSGLSNSYKTSIYSIPVPKDDDNKTYYIARATLCYFPKCDRLQGVDYTQRELSLMFGIVKDNIEDINFNNQDLPDGYPTERKSRQAFRKWENTKFISSLLREKNIRGKGVAGDGFWGLSLTSKDRSVDPKNDNISFGVVITLKNMKNENRINEFKHSCLLRGFIVNEINVDNKIDIYRKIQEDIKFE